MANVNGTSNLWTADCVSPGKSISFTSMFTVTSADLGGTIKIQASATADTPMGETITAEDTLEVNTES